MNYDIWMGRSPPVPRENLRVNVGAGGGLVLATTNPDPSGSLPVRHPPPHTTQDSAATGDGSAGQAREEANKPRNQPRRGGATCLPCLIGSEAPLGAGDLEIRRCEAPTRTRRLGIGWMDGWIIWLNHLCLYRFAFAT
jgi:hypothetical protein